SATLGVWARMASFHPRHPNPSVVYSPEELPEGCDGSLGGLGWSGNRECLGGEIAVVSNLVKGSLYRCGINVARTHRQPVTVHEVNVAEAVSSSTKRTFD